MEEEGRNKRRSNNIWGQCHMRNTQILLQAHMFVKRVHLKQGIVTPSLLNIMLCKELMRKIKALCLLKCIKILTKMIFLQPNAWAERGQHAAGLPMREKESRKA